MGAATIGDHALIGMGSRVGDGVVVEEGGWHRRARRGSRPDRVIEAGWIWVGSPAFRFRRIKPEERETFAEGRAIYVRYCAALSWRAVSWAEVVARWRADQRSAALN
jgi:carbonic anhydrase/acetyltransferase-like protein (isoleucine patch superfamily)